MSRLQPDTARRPIVTDTRLPAKPRIMALEQIARASLCLFDKSGVSASRSDDPGQYERRAA